MSHILVLGANGQVGRALKELLGDGCIALGRTQADLSQPSRLMAQLAEYNPAAVINAAAYTQVDKAKDEKLLAFTVNGEAPGRLAQYCLSRNIPLVHYSTDYVFDGEGEEPWTEEDETAPLNTYGESKLAGEIAIEEVGGEYLIFRTSWVYDAHGKNFFNTMLRLGGEREELKVVADQFGAPTYAPHLAEATLSALKQAEFASAFPSGVYHFCNGGTTSWHGFASRIFDEARKAGMKMAVQNVLPISSEEFPTPTKRPHNSRLDCSKAKHMLGASLPSWEAGLEACMKAKMAS